MVSAARILPVSSEELSSIGSDHSASSGRTSQLPPLNAGLTPSAAAASTALRSSSPIRTVRAFLSGVKSRL
jgi:hypothetical protein